MVEEAEQQQGSMFGEAHGVDSCVDTNPLAINAHMRYRARCHCGASYSRSTRAQAMQRLRQHVNAKAYGRLGAGGAS